MQLATINAKKSKYGIAGRGPVLGPMVYGAAYWEQENAAVMEGEGYDDSKVLSIEKREELYERIVHDKRMGYMNRNWLF